MNEIDFLIKLFSYLDYKLIDEKCLSNKTNQIEYEYLYHSRIINGSTEIISIYINFNFETGKVTGITCLTTYTDRLIFNGNFNEYLNTINLSSLRDFKISELNI